jgi:deoxyhypusine synthase
VEGQLAEVPEHEVAGEEQVLVLVVPEGAMGDEDRAHSTRLRGVHVGSRRVPHHPGVGRIEHPVPDQVLVAGDVLLREDPVVQHVAREAAPRDLGLLFLALPLGDDEEAVAVGERGQGRGDSGEEFDGMVADPVPEREEGGPGPLWARPLQRLQGRDQAAREGGRAVAVDAGALRLGCEKGMAGAVAAMPALLGVVEEGLDGAQEVGVVLPERVVGIEEERGHGERFCAARGRGQLPGLPSGRSVPPRATMTSKPPHARPVAPQPISGGESPRDLIETRFPAFLGRGLREAHRLLRQSLVEDCAVFATLSGAMTPAGLGSSAIVPLIESGAISCLTTTGANLYHDVHRLLGHAIRELDPGGSDIELREQRIIRIYDLGFAEEALLDTDRFFLELIARPEFQREMTTPEFHFELGRHVAALEDRLGRPYPTLLGACFRNEVPIFVGAVQDGSIFLNVVRLQREDPGFRLRLDIGRDVYQMGALQHLVRESGRRCAIWIFGGGVPKNYTLQGEPLLEQILGVPARGFDIDVQICPDVADNGALSPCTAGEGHTWGKTSAECVERTSAYLRTDVTLVLPFLAAAILGDPSLRRPPRRLQRELARAEARLDEVRMRAAEEGAGR